MNGRLSADYTAYLDFEVIEAGTPMTVTYDCVRTPDDFVFIDGYDF